MKTNNHLLAYLRSNPAWLFLTIVLFLSYVLTQVSRELNFATLLRFIGSLSMVSAPFLTFAHLWPNLKTKGRQLGSIVVFGLFGGALFWFAPEVQSLPFTRYLLEAESSANKDFVRLMVGLFVVLHLLLLWTERRNGQNPFFQWVRNISLTWAAVLITLVFSILLTFSSNDIVTEAQSLSRLGKTGFYSLCILQVFLIYFPYYILYYVHHHFLFRGLLRHKGVLYYLGGVICLLLLFTFVHGGGISFLPVMVDYIVHPAGILAEQISDVNLGISASVLAISFPFIVVVEWYKKEQAVATLTSEKSAAELQLLKEQINPHFFFNTLNNLYAMSLTEHQATPDTILKLSALMRYVIYRGKEAKVKIAEEIDYLKGYLDLQSIRLHQQLDLRFKTTLTEPELEVSPLLFVILVENAFKHGIEPAEGDCFLHLRMDVKDGTVFFSCHNSKPAPEATDPEPVAGIGLVNLRRRLELLYPGRFTLNLQNTPNDYLATLTITP